MHWHALNNYCCPKCGGHLRLIKANAVFVCEADGFAITQKRRAQLAAKYPIRTNPRIEAHFKDIVIA